MTNNSPLYSKSVQSESIDNIFHPIFPHQQAVLGTSQYSASPIYQPVDVSQTFANPKYPPMSTADVQSYRTGLSQGAVQKIQELKALMNKYSYYHTNADDIIRLAIFNSINGDDTLLDNELQQLSRLDSYNCKKGYTR